MTISATQCFLIVVIVFALIGLLRGWLREIVTTAIILGSIVFLSIGGSQYLSHFITQTVPGAFNYVVNNGHTTVGSSGSGPTFSPTVTLAVFGVLSALGYIIGHRFGRPPTKPTHRLVGIIPGTVNGLAIASYGSTLFTQASGGPPTLSVQGLTSSAGSQYYPLIFIVAIIVMLIVLFRK